MDAEIALVLPGALVRGATTAVLVGLLLLAAQHLGRRAAGLLTGLPTVTGPAMLWLAVDRGEAYAAAAAVSALAAVVVCAAFAFGYALASRSQRPAVALLAAVLAGLLPLPWLALSPWSAAVWLFVSSAACLACHAALRVLLRAGQGLSGEMVRAATAAPAPSRRGWLAAAVVSGLISGLATAFATKVGPFWTGVLISLPLLAAAVAVELHRRPGGAEEAQGFLRAYVAGLLVRGVFVAAFGAMILPAGIAAAFAVALALTMLAVWFSGASAALRRA